MVFIINILKLYIITYVKITYINNKTNFIKIYLLKENKDNEKIEYFRNLFNEKIVEIETCK